MQNEQQLENATVDVVEAVNSETCVVGFSNGVDIFVSDAELKRFPLIKGRRFQSSEEQALFDTEPRSAL